MHRFLTAAIALALLVAPAAARAQDGWSTHSYPAMNLTVDLPGEPVVSRSETDGVNETVISVDLGAAGALMVRVMDMANPDADQQAALDAAVAGGVAAVKARVVSLDRTTFHGWPARDAVICSASHHLCARLRLIMIEGRLHQLLVGYPLDGSPPDGTQRFLDSLTVGPRGTPV